MNQFEQSEQSQRQESNDNLNPKIDIKTLKERLEQSGGFKMSERSYYSR